MLNENDGMVMPVAPAYNNGNGFGNFGGDGWWILLLILFAGGGWGNGFGADGGLYPWMNQAEITNGGFANLTTQNQITAVQSDLGDIQTQLCGGFAGVNASIANGFAQAEIGANSRQMANMNQIFGLSQQFADCCCENRLATCQTQNIIQSEASATRLNDTQNTQLILDKLCALELDAKNEKISDLERQLTLANLSASQNLQTQTLLTDNLAQTNALEQYLAPVPRPAYVVQNPNCCAQNTCGCGSF